MLANTKQKLSRHTLQNFRHDTLHGTVGNMMVPLSQSLVITSPKTLS